MCVGVYGYSRVLESIVARDVKKRCACLVRAHAFSQPRGNGRAGVWVGGGGRAVRGCEGGGGARAAAAAGLLRPGKGREDDRLPACSSSSSSSSSICRFNVSTALRCFLLRSWLSHDASLLNVFPQATHSHSSSPPFSARAHSMSFAGASATFCQSCST